MTREGGPARSGASRRAILANARLMLVMTVRADDAGAFEALARALASGCVPLVQLRDRSGRDDVVERRARRVRALCAEHGALVLLNDRPDLAAALDLDGAHVGAADMPPARARERLGPDRLLGLSTHDPDEVAGARRAPVDYAGLGPCFASASKRLEREPGGSALVARCLPRAGDLPVFPIGGVTAGTVAELRAAGARRVAVGAGVLGASDPAAAAAAIHAALDPGPGGV